MPTLPTTKTSKSKDSKKRSDSTSSSGSTGKRPAPKSGDKKKIGSGRGSGQSSQNPWNPSGNSSSCFPVTLCRLFAYVGLESLASASGRRGILRDASIETEEAQRICTALGFRLTPYEFTTNSTHTAFVQMVSFLASHNIVGPIIVAYMHRDSEEAHAVNGSAVNPANGTRKYRDYTEDWTGANEDRDIQTATDLEVYIVQATNQQAAQQLRARAEALRVAGYHGHEMSGTSS